MQLTRSNRAKFSYETSPGDVRGENVEQSRAVLDGALSETFSAAYPLPSYGDRHALLRNHWESAPAKIAIGAASPAT